MVPFAAIKVFLDPSVRYVLHFEEPTPVHDGQDTEPELLGGDGRQTRPKSIAPKKSRVSKVKFRADLDQSDASAGPRNGQGATPSVASLEFIIVAGFVTTKAVRVRAPKKELRIVSIVDAITLLDAMKSIDELNRFWEYEAGLRKMGVGGMSS